MAAQATMTGAGQLGTGASGKSPLDFLSRWFKHFSDGRADRGQRIAYVHLARLSDTALMELGHDRHTIAQIRKVADHGINAY